MKILIAEDDPTIRANLVRTLRLEGYEPLAAENGAVALQLLAQHQPALILSDVSMPELDGHDLLQAVRADPRCADVPFVFLSARADRSDVREGMKLGADDYLTKPFQREELLDLVRTQLARAQQRSEQVQHLQQEAQRLISHDPLTDLPNRHGFDERVRLAVANAARCSGRLAVASLGIDGLADYRLTHGAQAADAAVRALADRLFAQIGTLPERQPVLARTGEDRFAVLLVGVDDEVLLEAELRPLLTAATRWQVGAGEVFFSPSMGVARYPSFADSAEMLLQRAEAAEPEAAPEGAMAFHSGATNSRLSRRVQLLQALHNALERGELSLNYQPQIATVDERVIGFEALLRWQHPQFGWVSPGEFIPIAEESGLIVAIGGWVLEQAVRQMQEWRQAGLGAMRIAVNLSTRQFGDDDLPSRVAAALQSSGLPAAALELEITESIALQSAERTLAILRTLKGLGVHLAMDDFGTGYSSLAYLKRYPLDVLKIDQAFIRNLTTDADDAAITRAVISLARSLNLQTVAEGVETQAHVDLLAQYGCDICQGYHYAKPMAADAATDWLMDRRELG